MGVIYVYFNILLLLLCGVKITDRFIRASDFIIYLLFKAKIKNICINQKLYLLTATGLWNT